MRADARFQELYASEFERIYRAAFVVFADKASAEDAAQEAFVRALERWGRLGTEPWVVGWIMKTAINLAKRNRRARLRDREQAQHTTPAPESGRAEAAMDLWRGVRALPKRQREVVVLHYIGDYSLLEIATVLGCREGTAKAHLHRARASLRSILGKETE